MHILVLSVFVSAIALGALSVAAHVLVLRALRRHGVSFSFGLSGVPGYLTERCMELPESSEREHILRLNRWSGIAFAVSALCVLVSGPFVNGP